MRANALNYLAGKYKKEISLIKLNLLGSDTGSFDEALIYFRQQKQKFIIVLEDFDAIASQLDSNPTALYWFETILEYDLSLFCMVASPLKIPDDVLECFDVIMPLSDPLESIKDTLLTELRQHLNIKPS